MNTKTVLLFLLLVLAACKPSNATSPLSAVLETQSLRVGKPSLVVKLEREGKALVGASVAVEGNMTHPGMAPVPGVATELGQGRYRIDGFDLNMAGDWILTIKAKIGDETLSSDINFSAQP